MANRFEGRGNLGAQPVLKYVEIDGEPRAVTEMRIYFDRSVPDGNGGFTDRGGFWLDVNIWGPRAEPAAVLLPRGARVHVTGTLIRDTWPDRDTGEERERMKLVADYVSLDLSRVDVVTLQESSDQRRAEPA